jgi:hypothetical protein
LPVIADPALASELSRYERVVLDLQAAALQIHLTPGAYTGENAKPPLASEEVMDWCQSAADALDEQRLHLVQALAAHRGDLPFFTPLPGWSVPPCRLILSPQK